jgi:hypothetical protein
MRFRLVYSGRLKASQTKSKDIGHIHSVRSAFHPQLKLLWSQDPLREYKQYWLAESPRADFCTHLSEVRCNKFASVIHSANYLLAHLDILFLRPAPPGDLFDNSGDIDNRIKTLLDALRVPKENEIPKTWKTSEEEKPFHCLLEDDRLISRFSVDTDRLLLKENHQQDALIIITVSLAASKGTNDTADLLV